MTRIKRIIALLMAVAVVFSLSGCLKYTSNILEVTRLNQGNFPGNAGIVQPSNVNPVTPPSVSANYIPSIPVSVTGMSVSGQPASDVSMPASGASDVQDDPSHWTTKEILSFTTAAVNKTKGYNSPIDVNHKENLACTVTKCPGGSAVMKIANDIIEKVVPPTDEIMKFNNGQTKNSEGEVVPLLLPKRGNFTLDVSGIASATAKKSGSDTVIHIQLVEETGTLTEHPKHQAASVGYLDASDVDLGPVKLNYLNVGYVGTTLDITVNSDGYVKSALYKIPIDVECEGKVFGMTASVACEGVQSEDWIIKW